MAEIASLFVRLGLKSQDFIKGMGNAYNRTKRLSNSLISMKRVAVGAFIGWGITRIIGEFEQLSATQEKAEAGLVQAMKSMGVHTKEFENKLFDTATQLQKMTTYGDETIMMGMKFLLTYKQIGTDVLPRAASVMTDIAALMGGDMRMAANMLGKAAMGLTGELRRAGITVERTTFESEGFLGVLREIESQVKGQAAALRATRAGGLEAFGNIVGDVKEKFGLFITTVKSNIANFALPAINKLNNRLSAMRKAGDLEKWAKQVADSIINLAKKAMIGTAGFIDTASGFISAIWNEIKFMWEGFKKLPEWVQSIGILGALLGGVKGKIILAGLLHLTNTLANSYEGFTQVLQGNIKWSEFATMNAEELARKLQELRDQGIIPLREELENLANINLETGKSFGPLKQRVHELLNELETLYAKYGAGPAPVGGMPVVPTPSPAAPAPSIFQQLQAFAQMLQGTGEQWKKIVSGSGDVFFKKIVSSGANVAIMWGELIIQIANAIQALIELPKRIIDALSDLFNAIGNFAKNLVKSLDGLIDAIYNAIVGIGDILGKLIPKLIMLIPELIRAIINAIPEVINAIVESVPIIVDTIIYEIPKIITEIIEMLPTLITALIELVPKIITEIIDKLPDIIEAFIKEVPRIAEAFLKALVELLPQILTGAFIPGIGGRGGFLDDIFGGLGGLFKFGGGGLFGGIGGFASDFIGGIGDVFGGIFHGGGLIPEGHRGLFIGKLRQDERPIIAQTGEEILARDDPRNIRNINQQGDVHLHIHGIVTTNDVRSWLSDLLLDSNRYRVGTSYATVDISTVGIDI